MRTVRGDGEDGGGELLTPRCGKPLKLQTLNIAHIFKMSNNLEIHDYIQIFHFFTDIEKIFSYLMYNKFY